MKKRKMKKYIPKETMYCQDCRWWKFLGYNNHYLGDCKYREDCDDECGTSAETRCKSLIIRCEYMGYTDDQNESLLWDRCKECDTHYPKALQQRGNPRKK